MVCRASLRARDRCDFAFVDQRGELRRLPVELGRDSRGAGLMVALVVGEAVKDDNFWLGINTPG
jgi:hypothetical protein